MAHLPDWTEAAQEQLDALYVPTAKEKLLVRIDAIRHAVTRDRPYVLPGDVREAWGAMRHQKMREIWYPAKTSAGVR